GPSLARRGVYMLSVSLSSFLTTSISLSFSVRYQDRSASSPCMAKVSCLTSKRHRTTLPRMAATNLQAVVGGMLFGAHLAIQDSTTSHSPCFEVELNFVSHKSESLRLSWRIV